MGSSVFDGLHQKKVRRCSITTAFSARRSVAHNARRGKTTKVVVHNLHSKMSRAEIEDLCRKYGRTKSVQITRDKEGCQAVVEMKNYNAASRLFDGLNGKKVKNMVIRTNFGPKFMKKKKGKSKGLKGSKKVKAKKKVKGSAFRGKDKLSGLNKKLKGMAIRGKGQKKRGIK